MEVGSGSGPKLDQIPNNGQNRTARAGEPEKDRQEKIGQNKAARTGLSGQDSQVKTARTGLPAWDC